MGNEERLQKILARAGYGSRRVCETIIEEGRVTVDGRVAHLGDKADPDTQQIMVDKRPLKRINTHRIYIMLNKPQGVISTTHDPHGRKSVRDLVSVPARIYPVGRLDYNSEGLILLTNDGQLTQQLTHPSYGHTRIYRVLVKGEPDKATLERWERGITLDGKYTRFDEVVIEHQGRDQAWLRVTVHEGRKHLVRRVVAALGHPALRLIRIAMGPIQLGDLSSGKWRYLTASEIKLLTPQSAPATKPKLSKNKRGYTSAKKSSKRRNRPSKGKKA